MIWNKRKKINIQPEQNEETRIQKNEERVRNLWDNFKCSNIWIVGVPEGEEEEQEIENLFEQKMKENFPNLAKEIDFQEVQEAQRVPKKLDPKRNTPMYIIIELPKIKDKERISPGWCGSVDWAQAVNQTVASSIPSQGTCLGCGPGPQ